MYLSLIAPKSFQFFEHRKSHKKQQGPNQIVPCFAGSPYLGLLRTLERRRGAVDRLPGHGGFWNGKKNDRWTRWCQWGAVWIGFWYSIWLLKDIKDWIVERYDDVRRIMEPSQWVVASLQPCQTNRSTDCEYARKIAHMDETTTQAKIAPTRKALR